MLYCLKIYIVYITHMYYTHTYKPIGIHAHMHIIQLGGDVLNDV